VFHIGVDIGGTFTDCVLVGEGTDGAATYGAAKTLSTRADPAEGVLAGLAELRLATELIRSGDDPAADMVLAG
jgi:N-methylhydantoinase A